MYYSIHTKYERKYTRARLWKNNAGFASLQWPICFLCFIVVCPPIESLLRITASPSLVVIRIATAIPHTSEHGIIFRSSRHSYYIEPISVFNERLGMRDDALCCIHTSIVACMSRIMPALFSLSSVIWWSGAIDLVQSPLCTTPSQHVSSNRHTWRKQSKLLKNIQTRAMSCMGWIKP